MDYYFECSKNAKTKENLRGMKYLILTKTRTLKDWFYLEMESHRAINDIIQTRWKEMFFFVLFSLCCKSCIKRISLLTDDGLYGRKSSYKKKNYFYLLFMNDEFILKNIHGGALP